MEKNDPFEVITETGFQNFKIEYYQHKTFLVKNKHFGIILSKHINHEANIEISSIVY